MQLEFGWLDLNTQRSPQGAFGLPGKQLLSTWNNWVMKKFELRIQYRQQVWPDFKEGDWLQTLVWIGLDWVASPSTWSLRWVQITAKRRKDTDENADLRWLWGKRSHWRGQQNCIRNGGWKSLLSDQIRYKLPREANPILSWELLSTVSCICVILPRLLCTVCIRAYVTELPEGKDCFLPTLRTVPRTS